MQASANSDQRTCCTVCIEQFSSKPRAPPIGSLLLLNTMSMTTNLRTMWCRLMDGSQKSQQAFMRRLQRPCFLEGKMPCRGKAWFPCTDSCKPDPWAGTPRGTTPKCWRLLVALADLPLLSRYKPPLLYLHIFWTSHLCNLLVGRGRGGEGSITQLQSTSHSVNHSHVLFCSPYFLGSRNGHTALHHTVCSFTIFI